MSRHRNILLMVVFVVMAVLACIPAENINADNKYISSAWNGTADVAEETDAGADADLGYPEVYTYENVVALTFDDDVIIGLSQEISYKEAVSMI